MPAQIPEILEYVDAGKAGQTARLLLAAEAAGQACCTSDRHAQIGAPPWQERRARQRLEPGK